MNPTSTNSKETQSQNIPTRIKIYNDGNDEDTQETCKKNQPLRGWLKKIEKSDGTKIVIF